MSSSETQNGYTIMQQKTQEIKRLRAINTELLEALKAIEKHHVEINTRRGRPLRASCTLAIARNAINKAEGE